MKVIWFVFRVLITCLSVLLGSMFYSARRNSVKKHRMKAGSSSNTDAELNVFFISDVHRREISAKLLNKVRTQQCPIDVVIIGGDLAEKGVPFERVKNNVAQLSTVGPVYYIWGNNDREIGEKTIRKIIGEVGGNILDNESMRIPGHPDWIISGADDPSSGKTNIQSTMSFTEDYTYQLLAVHNPSLFRKALQISEPSLMVAGHTHGGQIRLGPFGMQPRGAFVERNSRFELISNGYGTSLVPLRFGAPPETHLIKIDYEKRRGKEQHD